MSVCVQYQNPWVEALFYSALEREYPIHTVTVIYVGIYPPTRAGERCSIVAVASTNVGKVEVCTIAESDPLDTVDDRDRFIERTLWNISYAYPGRTVSCVVYKNHLEETVSDCEHACERVRDTVVRHIVFRQELTNRMRHSMVAWLEEQALTASNRILRQANPDHANPVENLCNQLDQLDLYNTDDFELAGGLARAALLVIYWRTCLMGFQWNDKD
jgi:hypothetical protein